MWILRLKGLISARIREQDGGEWFYPVPRVLPTRPTERVGGDPGNESTLYGVILGP